MKINYKVRAPNAMFFTKQILNEFPFGHIQATVYGPKRIGKSIYIILSQMDAYSIVYPEKEYGYGVDWRFKKALSNTIYSIKELILKTESLTKLYESVEEGKTDKQKIKIAIAEGVPEIEVHIDDGGVGFNKYIYFTDRAIVEELKNYLDTIGIVITGLPISTPSLVGVLGFIREYEGYRIHIIKRSNDFNRIAKFYKIIQMPGGQIKARRPKNDPYNCKLPDDLYRQYKKKRGFYLKQNIERLKVYQKRRENRQEREDQELKQTVKEAEDVIQDLKAENIL
jgi:hypothetical protein